MWYLLPVALHKKVRWPPHQKHFYQVKERHRKGWCPSFFFSYFSSGSWDKNFVKVEVIRASVVLGVTDLPAKRCAGPNQPGYTQSCYRKMRNVRTHGPVPKALYKHNLDISSRSAIEDTMQMSAHTGDRCSLRDRTRSMRPAN